MHSWKKAVLLPIFCWSFAAAGNDILHDNYVIVNVDDTTTSEEYPLGDYQDFFSTDDRPMLASFEFETGDQKCTIIDNLGHKFFVKKGESYSFSRVYFPFKVIDHEDNNACDNSSYRNIQLQVNSLNSYENKLVRKINQNTPFSNQFFPKLAGVDVLLSFQADFYQNFEDTSCLGLQITDNEGQSISIDEDNNKINQVPVVLPIRVRYLGRCLTSPLGAEFKENNTYDLRYSLRMGLNL
ncbi:MAG: hypothetical protein HRU19_02400 [Pseudobacteriovorax sp.]|nr:hypothetical protein [Pseudobacteriovorax sp.]